MGISHDPWKQVKRRLASARCVLVETVQSKLLSLGDSFLLEQAGTLGSDEVAALASLPQAACLGSELSQLRMHDQALQRIADGSYGKCAVCAQPIEAQRLEQMPVTYWCQACKLAFERRRGIVRP